MSIYSVTIGPSWSIHLGNVGLTDSARHHVSNAARRFFDGGSLMTPIRVRALHEGYRTPDDIVDRGSMHLLAGRHVGNAYSASLRSTKKT